MSGTIGRKICWDLCQFVEFGCEFMDCSISHTALRVHSLSATEVCSIRHWQTHVHANTTGTHMPLHAVLNIFRGKQELKMLAIHIKARRQ